MDNNLLGKLNILKIGYLKKIESVIPYFKAFLEVPCAYDIDELYLKVHSISGTSGMYGLSELSDISTEFEIYLKEIKNGNNLVNELELKKKLLQYINDIEKVVTGD